MCGVSKTGVEDEDEAPDAVRPGRPDEALADADVNGADWALLPKSRCEHDDAALREAKAELQSGVAREAPLLMRANPFISQRNKIKN
jgi:hypothetical protein